MSEAVQIPEGVFGDAYRRVRTRITGWMASSRLSRRTGGWTDRFLQYLLVLPDLVHLAIRLLLDRQVAPAAKGRLMLAMGYLMAPLDIIPDFIPCAGLIDDLLVMAVMLHKTLNTGSADLEGRLRANWVGDPEVFVKVREVVAVLNEVAAQIPKSLLNYIRRKG